MEIKPNLFIIGASKCGTTTLWNMLNSHSDVFMSTPKEPWFFSFSDYYKRLDSYQNLFKEVRTEKIIGEASPIYSETTLIPDIAERLYNYNPDSKIIYIVREPISRLKSVWRQTLSTGHWHTQIYKNYTDVKVSLMPKKFKKAVFEYPPFIEACKYWTHLGNYRKFYDDNNILLLFFEDLATDPENVYRRICNFLEIKPEISEDVYKKENSSEGKKMTRPWYIKLQQYRLLFSVLKSVARFLRINIGPKNIKYDIKVSRRLKIKINQILHSEKEQIIAYANKPLNFWEDV